MNIGFNNFNKNVLFNTSSFNFPVLDNNYHIKYNFNLDRAVYALKPIGESIKEVSYDFTYTDLGAINNIKALLDSQYAKGKNSASKVDNINTTVYINCTYKTSGGGTYFIDIPFSLSSQKLAKKTAFQKFINTIFYIDVFSLITLIIFLKSINDKKKRDKINNRYISKNIRKTVSLNHNSRKLNRRL